MELPRVIKYAWERLEYLNAKRHSLSAAAFLMLGSFDFAQDDKLAVVAIPSH